MRFLVLLFLLPSLAYGEKSIYINAVNAVPFYGAIKDNDPTFEMALDSAVLARGKQKYPIYLVINSPGGSVYQGLKFADKAYKVENLHIVVVNAYSMAANIVQLLSGSKRFYLKDVEMLYHSFRHTLVNMPTQELVSYAQRVYQVERIVNEAIMIRSGLDPIKFYSLVMTDKVIKGPELLKLNLVDEQVKVSCSQQAKQNKVPYITATGVRMVSLCPLVF